ncbi:MAG: hypothetical protein ACRERU_17085 [Methylococcales bacterium]
MNESPRQVYRQYRTEFLEAKEHRLFSGNRKVKDIVLSYPADRQ